MSYCPYCGRQLSDDMSFCPGCGAALNSEIKSYTVEDTITSNSGDYKIYIASLGSANKSQVIDLLEDVLGYTSASATNLVKNIPVQIAGNLSLKQAAIVAQAFEEYGVELTVTNNDEYEDISSSTSGSSIFNSDGSFLASAAIILATLGATNRLRAINKPKKPSLLERLFHSLFSTPKKKPVHIRRSIRPRNMDFRVNKPQQPKRTVRQQIYPSGNRPQSQPSGNKPGNNTGMNHGNNFNNNNHQGSNNHKPSSSFGNGQKPQNGRR